MISQVGPLDAAALNQSVVERGKLNALEVTRVPGQPIDTKDSSSPSVGAAVQRGSEGDTHGATTPATKAGPNPSPSVEPSAAHRALRVPRASRLSTRVKQVDEEGTAASTAPALTSPTPSVPVLKLKQLPGQETELDSAVESSSSPHL